MAKNRRSASFGMPLSWGVRFEQRIVRQLEQLLRLAEQSEVMVGGLKPVCR
jgi:hypothetical protein